MHGHVCVCVCVYTCVCVCVCTCVHVCVNVPASPDARPTEQAVEASEASTGPSDRRKGPRGAYTEHIFTDPLGAQKKDPPAGYSQRYL